MTISEYEYSYYLDGSDACKMRNENGIIETTEYEYDGLKRLTEESVKVGDNTTDSMEYMRQRVETRANNTCTSQKTEPHGNSKKSQKPQHGYEIYDTNTGDVVKTGISG